MTLSKIRIKRWNEGLFGSTSRLELSMLPDELLGTSTSDLRLPLPINTPTTGERADPDDLHTVLFFLRNSVFLIVFEEK